MTATTGSATEANISRLWRRLNPDHYFEKDEIAILRAYFGMQPRWFDPPLESLYTAAPTPVLYRGEEDQEKLVVKGPVRLHRIDSCDVTEVQNAVARICLAEIQDRLPQWSCGREDGVIIARPPIERGDRLLTPLAPQPHVHQLGRLGAGILVAGGGPRHLPAGLRPPRRRRLGGLYGCAAGRSVLSVLEGDEMVLLHGFIKKERSTPKLDLELARQRLKKLRSKA